MTREFQQLAWDDRLRDDWQRLLDLAYQEDLGRQGDLTSRALVPEDAAGRAAVVARRQGVVAGLPALDMTLRRFDPRLRWIAESQDGRAVAPGGSLGRIEGPARGMLSAERLLLNLLGRLSGIATLTRAYVGAVAGTKARIYDTRKTTPGWRRLEKYAVRCGGGWNHRSGLNEAVLIKDNHLAFGAERLPAGAEAQETSRGARGVHCRYTPAGAVVRARQFLETLPGHEGREAVVEVEVDTLAQLDEVLGAGPDLVLLDNMGPETLRQAVARRDARSPAIELEASGGVGLDTVRAIAESGIDRISVGALTHSAVALDIALDWL